MDGVQRLREKAQAQGALGNTEQQKIIVDQATKAGDATKFVDVIESRLRAEMPHLKRIYIELGDPPAA